MDALGDFLRTRRARLRPADVGLPQFSGGDPFRRRKVPGLRREELAQAAGMSVDYYVRLEQGRARNVSDAVLDSLARVLNLDDDERAHLFRLARPVRGSSKITGKNRRAQRVRPGLRLLLDSMDNVPAFIVGRGMEVLAWNTLGNALCGLDKMPPDQRSIVRYFVLNEQARDLYPDWETVIAETVAFLRLEAGRYPDDEELAALVGELSIKSATFRELWARHNVREKTFGTKRFQHPVVGELTLSFETLRLPGDPDQAMVTYTAEPGSPSADALRLLASWTAESTSEHESERELRRN